MTARFCPWILVLAVACSGGDDGDPDAGPNDASTTSCGRQGETTACTDLEETFVSGMAECGTSGRWIIDGCVAGDGGPCTVASGCESGLACAPQGGAVGVCRPSCDPAASGDCPAGFACAQIAQDEGVCIEASQGRDQPCGSGLACSDPGTECLESFVGFFASALECKLTCDPLDWGTQGSCPTGELCLENPVGHVEVQLNANGEQVTCVDEAPCNGNAGFFCIPAPQVGGLCARPTTWCGVEAPLITGPLTGLTGEDVCGFPGDSRYCAPLPDGDAIVVCEPLVSVFATVDSMGNTLPCTGNEQCPAQLGLECVPDPSGGGVCGRIAQGCLAFCEGPNGQNLDCGLGLTCTRLAIADYPGFGLEIQLAPDGMSEQACTGPGDPACEVSYDCVEFAPGDSICVRAPKICVR